MSELIFVSNNIHKLTEIRKLVPQSYTLYSMYEAGVTMEIEETGSTFNENASLKAHVFFSTTNKNCFADDSGLAVDSLEGRPGVFSARYAGMDATDATNRKKLLHDLSGIENRRAAFITVICLLINGQEHFFEGKINGLITDEERGDEGFGYDSIFVPNGYLKTFAQMKPEEKNRISHRAIAVKKMVEYLNTQR